MAYTDKNLYAYCDNNPVMRVDNGGEFWDTVFDVISLCVSVVDVVKNPDDPWAWAGLAADVVSLAVPFATGGGAVVKAVSKVDDVVDLAKTADRVADTADNVYDGVKAMSKVDIPDCFVAGTMVATEDGHKPIETIEVGDYVWATDEETGETSLKQVVNTFINETTAVTHVTINGEVITSTQTHPYYVVGRGWTLAGSLQAGDILVMLNGEKVVLELVQHEILETPVKTYNFEVADFHTYYVGTYNVLVHNKCVFGEFVDNPQSLWGKTADDLEEVLGSDWTRGTYGSSKTGWKFTNGDKMIAYHPGGGKHVGNYYKLSSGQVGKIKIVGPDYVRLPGDKARIIDAILD